VDRSGPAIAIVVDPHFGERLAELAERMPVWIVDTPANRSAAERVWRSAAGGERGPREVTTFRADPAGTRADWIVAIAAEVDLHHGEWSEDPPYAAIEVVGADPTDPLRAALGAYGLTVVERTADGFRGSRPPGSTLS
jgi:hypothetical protein